MKIYILPLLVTLGFSSVSKSEDYEAVKSRLQMETIIDLDGSKSVKMWEYFEVKIKGGDTFVGFKLVQGNLIFAMGTVNVLTAKYNLEFSTRKPSEKEYKFEVVTVREDNSKIVRLSFFIGILPTNTTLQITPK